MKRATILLLIVMAAIAIITCSDDSVTGPEENGVKLSGTVLYGRCLNSVVPIGAPSPYCSICSVPVTVIATNVKDGRYYRTTTDTEARYELNLPPGEYLLETESYSWLTDIADTVEASVDTNLDLLGEIHWDSPDTIIVHFYYIGSDTLSSDSEFVLLEELNRNTGNHLDLAQATSYYVENFKLRVYHIPHDLEIHPYYLAATLNQSITNDTRGIYPYKTYATLAYFACPG